MFSELFSFLFDIIYPPFTGESDVNSKPSSLLITQNKLSLSKIVYQPFTPNRRHNNT